MSGNHNQGSGYTFKMSSLCLIGDIALHPTNPFAGVKEDVPQKDNDFPFEEFKPVPAEGPSNESDTSPQGQKVVVK